MKRLGSSHKLIADNAPLLVRFQLALFKRDLFSEFFKSLLHRRGGSLRIDIMDRNFVKPAVQKFCFDRRSWGTWQQSILRLYTNLPQSWLLAGNENTEVERLRLGPSDQLFRRITPTQSEGRLKNSLGTQVCSGESDKCRSKKQGLAAWFGGRNPHAGSLTQSISFRKPRRALRGFALIEATMAMTLLSVTGLLLLNLSLNVIQPRQYVLHQILSDSYLTFERSWAERIPFESLVAPGSPWPDNTAIPAVSTEVVEIGRLPGDRAVTGTVTRTRFRDANNILPGGAVGGGTEATNPASMQVWQVQSILRYEISGRTYVKSRTVIRAQ